VIIYGYWQKFQKRVVNWAIENKKSLAYISDAELKRKRFFFHELVKSVYLRFFFAKIDYFLVVGDSNACFYLKHGVSERKLVNSPFPIDIVNYMKVKSNYVKNRNEFRGQFEVADGELVFTMVGKAVSWKRPLDVISLLYEIEKFTTIKICFFFIGSGPLLNLMKELAGNLCRCRVVFPGFVNPEDLPRFYAGTDLYIHTASYEPHSLAVSEAIFMGCPILISDRCGSYGLNDDVQPGVNGEIYKCGDINDLFNNVVKLVTTPNLLSEYSLNSSRIAEFKQTQAHFGGISTLFNKFHFANE
jgi:glycosyltransferase involved in cell wall biosynthesis